MSEQKKNMTLDEYLSFVRHELRTQLWLIREGVSQVKDGLGGKDCSKCFEMLEAVIKAADDMTDQVSKFLNAPEFREAVKELGGGEKPGKTG